MCPGLRTACGSACEPNCCEPCCKPCDLFAGLRGLLSCNNAASPCGRPASRPVSPPAHRNRPVSRPAVPAASRCCRFSSTRPLCGSCCEPACEAACEPACEPACDSGCGRRPLLPLLKCRKSCCESACEPACEPPVSPPATPAASGVARRSSTCSTASSRCNRCCCASACESGLRLRRPVVTLVADAVVVAKLLPRLLLPLRKLLRCPLLRKLIPRPRCFALPVSSFSADRKTAELLRSLNSSTGLPSRMLSKQACPLLPDFLRVTEDLGFRAVPVTPAAGRSRNPGSSAAIGAGNRGFRKPRDPLPSDR